MKAKTIKFFSPDDNAPAKVKSKRAPTGYVSRAGKLVFPAATLEALGIDPTASQFMISTDEGKRKLKSLILSLQTISKDHPHLKEVDQVDM